MHDFGALILHFHFLFGVTAVEKNIDVRQNVEGNRVRINLRRQLSILAGGGDLFFKLVDRALSAAGDGLITGGKHSPNTERTMERINRHQRDRGCAIWVSDDPAMLLHVLSIDLRDY